MQNMKEAVTFRDYDRISDDIMYFGSGVQLRFVVNLSKKGQDGKRYHFLNTYRYNSKYDDYGKVLTVRRHLDYYLSIDIKNNYDLSLQITQKDVLNVRAKLRAATKWFSGGIFKIDKQKKLHVTGSPGVIPITTHYGKFISLQPTIITYDNNEQKEGIRMFINSDSFYIDYPVDTFMEFVYVMDSINMYQSAITMLNYIQPEFIINDIANESIPDTDMAMDDNCDAKIKKSITAKPAERKSFFDIMDDM